jgi:hypothetical protein
LRQTSARKHLALPWGLAGLRATGLGTLPDGTRFRLRQTLQPQEWSQTSPNKKLKERQAIDKIDPSDWKVDSVCDGMWLVLGARLFSIRTTYVKGHFRPKQHPQCAEASQQTACHALVPCNWVALQRSPSQRKTESSTEQAWKCVYALHLLTRPTHLSLKHLLHPSATGNLWPYHLHSRAYPSAWAARDSSRGLAIPLWCHSQPLNFIEQPRHSPPQHRVSEFAFKTWGRVTVFRGAKLAATTIDLTEHLIWTE